MQVHYSLDSLPDFKHAVITIGTFDGVHEGHRKIIKELKLQAEKAAGESIIITFHPHPRNFLRPGDKIGLLNTLQEKIELLEATSVDHLVVVPFTKEFSELPAHEYISSFLIKSFKPHSIIIGYDHHFGKDRIGNFTLLEEMAETYNYKLLEIPKHVLNEIDVSSTKIRHAITRGEVDIANKLLGYDFFFEGLVVPGDQLGRKLGYPTANLEYTSTEKIRLGHGVFAAYVKIGDAIRKGMLSIGTRPTLNTYEEKIEVNIFEWEKDIYGEKIVIIVSRFLRQQVKYNSLEDLTRQLAEDQRNTLAIL